MKNFEYTVNGNDYKVNVVEVGEKAITLEVNGERYVAQLKEKGATVEQTPAKESAPTPAPAPEDPPSVSAPTQSSGGSPVIAPLPGVIVKILVKAGDSVEKGQKVAVLEAMKMENDLKAPLSGKVLSVGVAEGESVPEGSTIITIG
ncbi:MAG: biotin/lipoyl-containing protein [Porphyromonas sp.]|nr:biotin/lipoyl-containing protein [Porphyromonas sp.]